jgi:hypothetical protein
VLVKKKRPAELVPGLARIAEEFEHQQSGDHQDGAGKQQRRHVSDLVSITETVQERMPRAPGDACFR